MCWHLCMGAKTRAPLTLSQALVNRKMVAHEIECPFIPSGGLAA